MSWNQGNLTQTTLEPELALTHELRVVPAILIGGTVHNSLAHSKLSERREGERWTVLYSRPLETCTLQSIKPHHSWLLFTYQRKASGKKSVC